MTMACSNIGPRGVRRRHRSGLMLAAISLAMLAALLWFDAPRWSRLLLFAPAWMAALSLLQAREKT